ncbi:ALG9 mannosyltransferase, partial [Polypterus senegalus]
MELNHRGVIFSMDLVLQFTKSAFRLKYHLIFVPYYVAWSGSAASMMLSQTHYLLYGKGFQTWEYSPAYAIRSYAYLWLHALPAWFHAKVLQTNKGPVVAIDSYYYGKLVNAPVNILLYNVFTAHGPDLYGKAQGRKGNGKRKEEAESERAALDETKRKSQPAEKELGQRCQGSQMERVIDAHGTGLYTLG